ncbi:ecdysone biosynthesis protein-like protein [Dinothrombium tinctorium]|uniref:Ecdysone biosynthesis protein-like protein n=1 Tax=Dinothrombium tinctorium TaxID=1965070 RepID=A0A443R4U8_9ACAR|nr:ecdysone biosynthesis protein-like protein [Dinothrombium tinctorium]
MEDSLITNCSLFLSLIYPPSPPRFPIIGHMHLLAKYERPWDGFDAIRKQYGNVVSLQLGSKKCVLVSSMSAIKEVLITRADAFANRPHFDRYLLIFGGDRENSMALCDWSELHRFRRTLAQNAILPRYGSDLFKHLESCIHTEFSEFIVNIVNEGEKVLPKLDLLAACYNIFISYLCSQRFDVNDSEFRRQVYGFDFVFWDINQCYAIDFIPTLEKIGIARSYLKLLGETCDSLRNYIEDKIVKPRLELRASNEEHEDENAEDFLDVILQHHFENPISFNWQVCMFELGDLLGGNSAVGNMMMRLLGHLAVNPKCQAAVLNEARSVLARDSTAKFIMLKHRVKMPYTEAAFLETLRIASSPIVPHIATEDTVLQDFDIDKDTMIMFNSYHLNTSSQFWEDPKEFNPNRFLVAEQENSDSESAYRLNKPDYFFPFSFGKRACLGYKMVSTITFMGVTNLVLNFEISANQLNQSKIEEQLASKGCLALHCDDCFELILTPRV